MEALPSEKNEQGVEVLNTIFYTNIAHRDLGNRWSLPTPG